MSRSNGERMRSLGAWVALALGAALVAVAAWLILVGGEPRPAGLAVAGGGVALLVGGSFFAHRVRDERWRARWWFVDSAVDRLFDAAVLGAIAWANRDTGRAVSAGAIVAIGSGYLGAYVRARGSSLGYQIEESAVTRAVRYGVLAVGLLAAWLSWAVWVVAAVSLIAALVRASQVAKEERA